MPPNRTKIGVWQTQTVRLTGRPAAQPGARSARTRASLAVALGFRIVGCAQFCVCRQGVTHGERLAGGAARRAPCLIKNSHKERVSRGLVNVKARTAPLSFPEAAWQLAHTRCLVCRHHGRCNTLSQGQVDPNSCPPNPKNVCQAQTQKGKSRQAASLSLASLRPSCPRAPARLGQDRVSFSN